MNDKLINLFREAFPSLAEAEDDTIRDATVNSVSDWESITSLNLLMLIEAEYEISIPDETAAELQSFLAVEAYLESLEN